MARILVVDDDEIIRSILKEILGNQGYDVLEASDGDSCVEQARMAKPDLILLDMTMPKMTGFEVAPVLRTHPATKNVPIIALTGDNATESIEAAHEAGCDHYITKPIDAGKILRLLDKLLSA